MLRMNKRLLHPVKACIKAIHSTCQGLDAAGSGFLWEQLQWCPRLKVRKKKQQKNPWEEWIWHHKKWHHRTSHFWILFFFFWEFMHVKGRAMFKFRCFWNCSFIAHMFLAWFLQSWKPTRFFIVTGWPMILISFKMWGAQFTLVMASSHQSISFFFGWKYMGVTLENPDAAAILSHQHLWSVGDFQTFWSLKIAYWL